MSAKYAMGWVPRIRTNSRWRWLSTGILTILVLGMFTVADAAKGGNPGKPPGDTDPPPDPPPPLEGGLVYIEGGEGMIYELDMDTQTYRALFDPPPNIIHKTTWHTPSDFNHPIDDPSDPNRTGRWFAVEYPVPEDGDYPRTDWRPLGFSRRAIFVVDEDGNAYRLIYDNSLEPMQWLAWTAPRWVNGDTEIWFTARKLDADGEIVEGTYGFYRMWISILADGSVSVTDPVMVPYAPVFDRDDASNTGTDYLLVAYTLFDVSPDGSVLYYTKLKNFPEGGAELPLYMVDLANGGIETVIYGGIWWFPEYSPEQNAILGAPESSPLARIEAAASSEPIILAENTSSTEVTSFGVWSPSGNQVIYGQSNHIRGNKWVQRIKVITSDDATTVVEMDSPLGAGRFLGWFPKN